MTIRRNSSIITGLLFLSFVLFLPDETLGSHMRSRTSGKLIKKNTHTMGSVQQRISRMDSQLDAGKDKTHKYIPELNKMKSSFPAGSADHKAAHQLIDGKIDEMTMRHKSGAIRPVESKSKWRLAKEEIAKAKTLKELQKHDSVTKNQQRKGSVPQASQTIPSKGGYDVIHGDGTTDYHSTNGVKTGSSSSQNDSQGRQRSSTSSSSSSSSNSSSSLGSIHERQRHNSVESQEYKRQDSRASHSSFNRQGSTLSTHHEKPKIEIPQKFLDEERKALEPQPRVIHTDDKHPWD